MFLCFVLVGDSYVSKLAQERFKEPPNKPNGKSYDSVNGAAGTHYIIYENRK